MKKYKLIQEYPGGPPLNSIAEPCLSLNIPIVIENYKINTPNKVRFLTTSSIEIFTKFPNFWEEVNEPIFISEDGVEIFEGYEGAWSVNTETFEMFELSPISKDYQKYDNYKTFSNKEKTRHFRFMNIQSLSLQDIIEVIELDRSDITKLFNIVGKNLNKK